MPPGRYPKAFSSSTRSGGVSTFFQVLAAVSVRDIYIMLGPPKRQVIHHLSGEPITHESAFQCGCVIQYIDEVVSWDRCHGDFTQTIVDKGRFAPGVQINHAFEVDSVISELPNAACNVTEVDFADGSVWRIASSDFRSEERRVGKECR